MMNNRFNNPFCPHCKDFLVESVIDRYSQYVGVKESWNILRDTMETIDSSLLLDLGTHKSTVYISKQRK